MNLSMVFFLHIQCQHSITESMSKASEAIFDNNCAGTNRRNNTHSIPGWNEHVDELHNIARQSFVEWIVHGKPKHGTVFDDMKRSRARFKYELRCLKRHKNQQICDNLANQLQGGRPERFWKEINRISKCKVSLPNCIDGVTGAGNICELWKNHFHQLLNCIHDDDALHVDVIYSSEMIITVDEIEFAISQLEKNKSCGIDGIYAENLLYCSRRVLPLLAMCLSSLFIHGFLPDSMLSVVLVPVIKNKSRRINDSDNYRPIALASIVSKVVEKVILNRISEYLLTTCNQFGFKNKLGTDMCIYALKEILENHRSHNGSMFMGFLDASKAFDRLKHTTLFRKLIDRRVPNYIVRIMMYWYANQTMCVRWSGIVSHGFHVTNGVRQGGILSPFLFNVYLDDLSIALSACRTGCSVGNSLINHLMYADDLVIFSPSSIGLRALITVCEEYAVSHEMVFNHKKSVILICRSKYMKNVYPVFTLNGKIINESDTVRYLGHILCNSGKDDKDIMRQCQQLYARGNVLLRKFHMCSMSVKIQLFNTYCSPMYTAQLWWNHTVASFHRLNVAYNNVLRRLLRRPRFCSASGLFAECRIPNCKAVIRNLIFRFMTRLDLSTNSIISIILVSDIRWTSRIRRHWIKSLYVHHNIV